MSTEQQALIEDHGRRLSALEKSYTEKRKEWERERAELCAKAAELQRQLARCYWLAVDRPDNQEDWQNAPKAIDAVRDLRRGYVIAREKLAVFIDMHQTTARSMEELEERLHPV